MTVEITISPGATLPIYKQIINQVQLAIVNGILVKGDRLPSVRSLAEELVINPNTVSRAYRELVHDGILEFRHGQGVFVAEKRQIFSRKEEKRRLERAIEAFLKEVLFLNFTHTEIIKALETRINQVNPRNTGKGGHNG